MILRLLVLFLAIAIPLAATQAGWDGLANFDFNAVDATFQETTRPLSREERLVWAVARINRQPRTDAQVDQAIAMLETIRAEDGGDEVGLWTTFQLGRIEENHRTPRRPAEAARIYRDLLAKNPTHPAAVRARVKLAVLLLYEPAVEPSREAGFAAAEALLAGCPEGPPRSELHALIGRAAVFFRWPAEKALPHLEAALDGGVATEPLRRALLITSAELAARVGQPSVALRRLRRFASDFPRDSRINYVVARIAALERTQAAGPEGRTP